MSLRQPRRVSASAEAIGPSGGRDHAAMNRRSRRLDQAPLHPPSDRLELALPVEARFNALPYLFPASFLADDPGVMDMLGGMVLLLLAPILLGMIGLVVIGSTFMMTSRRRLPTYPSCGGCGYDLSGSLGRATTCPECGSPFTTTGIRPAGTGKMPARFLVGAAMFAVGLLLVLWWGAAVFPDY